MEILNEIRISMPSLSSNESAARAAVSSFIVQTDPTVEELSDIRTAVSEAVTNAIVHGYRGTSGIIELVIRLLPGREIYIRVKDSGCGITDIKKAMEPLFGFSVMESFMDRLSVRSKVGQGTTVTMRKKLAAHGS